MTIQVGDAVPSVGLFELGDNGPMPVPTSQLFRGKKVALFGLPGAFTPTCSAKHVPGFMAQADALKAKGIDSIVCIAVNDAFVMGAWGKDQNVGDTIRMIADGDAEFTKEAGLELDLTGNGLGLRCQRFAMIVNDGNIEWMAIDEPGTFEATSAESLLENL